MMKFEITPTELLIYVPGHIEAEYITDFTGKIHNMCPETIGLPIRYIMIDEYIHIF